MDLKQLRELNSFSKTPEKTNRLTVNMVMTNFRYYADRITANYDLYQTMVKSDILAQNTLDSIRCNLNDYTQAFMHIVPVLATLDERDSNYVFNSLSACIRYFTSAFGGRLTLDGREWITFVQHRNDLEHAYYDYEYNKMLLEDALLNYSSGVQEIVSVCQQLVSENQLGELQIKVSNRRGTHEVL